MSRSSFLPLALVLLLSTAAACARPDSAESTVAERPTPTAPETAPEHEETNGHEDGEAHEEHEEHEEHEDSFIELSAEAASRIEIRTETPRQRVLLTKLETTGQVDFDQTRLAHVSPRITGRVHRVDAVLGQAVRAGQKLAEIDSIELGQAKAAYLQAKAQEELARGSFERARDLFADRITSEQEMLEAEAQLREATIGLYTAEETLRLYGLRQPTLEGLAYRDRSASIYPLRAPFDGTITERHATLGELVTPERNLFTLADLGRVWIWIDVYQRELSRVHIDDQARARVDTFPGEVFAGQVSYLSARVDSDTRTVRARLDVANPEGKLRPGMFVQVELIDPHGAGGAEDRAASLTLPQEALVRHGERSFVFVAAGQRRYEHREIRLGREVGGFAEVIEGLGPEDSVVVEGVFLLKSALSRESLGGGHSH